MQVALVQRIAISPSVRLAIALCAAHIAAAGLFWLVPMPPLAKATLTLAAAVSLVFFLARDAALHAPQAIVALEIQNGGISFHTRAGDWVGCEVLGSSYVSPGLTIVHLRPHGRRWTRRVILVPDNVDQRDFRRLRVWLRWKHGEGREPEPGAGQ